MGDEDALAVAAVLAGNGLAYAELVSRYQHQAERWAMHHLANWEVAEAVAQDGFVEAYLRLPSLRDPCLFGSWLRAIVTNLAITEVRHRARMISLDWIIQSHGDGALSERYHTEQRPTADVELQAREEAAQLERALGALPSDYRKILRLFYLEDSSYAQMARVLGESVPAVRSMLHRARLALRKEMKSRGDETDG